MNGCQEALGRSAWLLLADQPSPFLVLWSSSFVCLLLGLIHLCTNLIQIPRKTGHPPKHKLYANMARLLNMINNNDIGFMPKLKINRGRKVSLMSANTPQLNN